jgi:hypothetical protein
VRGHLAQVRGLSFRSRYRSVPKKKRKKKEKKRKLMMPRSVTPRSIVIFMNAW